MEHRGRRPGPSAHWPTTLIRRLRDASLSGGCCITARANGIPGESAAALGLLGFTGARTACRSGMNPDLIAAGRQGHATVTTPRGRRQGADRLGIAGKLGLGSNEDYALSLPIEDFRAMASSRKAPWRPMSIPTIPSLKCPEERARMAREFERGSDDRPTGYVLPVQAWMADTDAWLSGTWRTRRGAAICSCCPAIQPIGFRLPLGFAALCAAGSQYP